MTGRIFPAGAALALALSLTAQGVAAADWKLNGGVSGELVYTDNIDLDASGTRGGTTARINPRINLTGTGRRLQLDFSYSPSYLQRLYSGGGSEFVHNMSAGLSSELYQDVLFLDARANAGLTLVDPFGIDPGDGINETDNTRQTYGLSISPYILQHFGTFADLNLGYGFSKVWDEGTSDSDGHDLHAALSSGRRFQVLTWGVNASYRRTEYDAGGSSTYANVQGRIGYALSRKWRLNAYLGYDDNDYNTTGQSDDNGVSYGGGATWTPSPRTTFDFSVAKRYFGTNLYFDFRHKSRRNVWTASLSHEPYNARTEVLERQTFLLVDAFGNPVLDPAGAPVFISLDTPQLGNTDYVRRQFTIGYTRNMRRGSLGVNAYYTQRDYVDNSLDSRSYGLSANLRRALLNHLDATLGLRYGRNSDANSNRESTNWSIRAGLTRQLSASTNLSLNLQHTEQTSDDPNTEYSENRITLTLGTSWN